MPEGTDGSRSHSLDTLPPLGTQRSALSARISALQSDLDATVGPAVSGDFRVDLPDAPVPTVTEYGTPNFSAISAFQLGTPFGYLVSTHADHRNSSELEVWAD